MSDDKVAAGGVWIGGPLSWRWARALACGHTGAAAEWQTLFPELHEAMWKRYFQKIHVAMCERAARRKGGMCLTPGTWRSKYEAFAKAVLESETAPSLKVPEPLGAMQFLRIDYERFLGDIAESANMIQEVVALGHSVWKLGQVRVAKRMDTHPVVRFVGKLDTDSRSTLAYCASGKFPGGVLLPEKETISKDDFVWLKGKGFAVFGVVEDCQLNDSMRFVVRDPAAWVKVLETQVHPGELKAAKMPAGVMRHVFESNASPTTIRADEKNEQQGPSERPSFGHVAPESGQAETRQSEKKEPPYPLKIGKLTVHDEDWTAVSFGNTKRLPIGGQIQKLLRSMYQLDAVSKEKAKECAAILKQANITSRITIVKPFSAGGNKTEDFKRLYSTCITNSESRRGYPGRYFLTP